MTLQLVCTLEVETLVRSIRKASKQHNSPMSKTYHEPPNRIPTPECAIQFSSQFCIEWGHWKRKTNVIWSQKVESKIQRNRSKTTMASSERRSTVLRHRSSTQTLWAPPMINEKRHQSTKWNKDTKFVHRMQLDVGARPAKWRIWMGSSDFFRRPSKAFATNQLPPLCHLILYY